MLVRQLTLLAEQAAGVFVLFSLLPSFRQLLCTAFAVSLAATAMHSVIENVVGNIALALSFRHIGERLVSCIRYVRCCTSRVVTKTTVLA